MKVLVVLPLFGVVYITIKQSRINLGPGLHIILITINDMANIFLDNVNKFGYSVLSFGCKNNRGQHQRLGFKITF